MRWDKQLTKYSFTLVTVSDVFPSDGGNTCRGKHTPAVNLCERPPSTASVPRELERRWFCFEILFVLSCVLVMEQTHRGVWAVF